MKTSKHIKKQYFFFLLFLMAFASITVRAQFQVKVKFLEIANLTYQIDCVGNLPVNCSAGNLSELWKREFLQTDKDRRMLKEWKRLRELYSSQVKINKSSEGTSLFDKIRIAGFQASTVEDYAERLDLLTDPADRRSFENVIRHFYPKFHDWWQREAIKSGDDFARQTDALLRLPKIAAPLKQFYNFYAPDLPENYEISFNLLYIPDSVKEPSSGQQLQNYSLMEFKAKDRPAQRIDLAVHELCHFFYDNLPPENRVKLEQSFFNQNRAGATPAYNLLNETLAAAFGNGMIARSVTPPDEYEKYVAAKNSFYNNDAIDRAAKAVLPWLDDWLKKGKTINDPEFINQYISVLEKSFGEDLLKPKLYLSEMFLFVDGKYGVSMRRQVRRTLETVSFYAAEGLLTDKNLSAFKNNPRLNSVFIAHPDNVAELVRRQIISGAQAKQIQTEFDSKQMVLFASERAPFTYVFVVVAKDADSAIKQIEKLSVAQKFQGIYQSSESPLPRTQKPGDQKLADLRAQIEQIAESAGGKVGAAAELLETGEIVSLNFKQRFPMQSVFKLPVAMAVLQMIDAGKIKLDQIVRVEQSDLVGKHLRSPIRDKFPDGTKFPVSELLRYMVSESEAASRRRPTTLG